MDYKEQYQYVVDSLQNFKNYVEVDDFRKFLLLVLNLESGGPEAVLRQLGMASRDKITLPFDPLRKIYFTKIVSGLSMMRNQLVIYHKSEKISESFVNKPESDLFQQTLSEFELKNLLPDKLVLVTPEVVDFSTEILTGDNAIPQAIVGVAQIRKNGGVGDTICDQLFVKTNRRFVFLAVVGPVGAVEDQEIEHARPCGARPRLRSQRCEELGVGRVPRVLHQSGIPRRMRTARWILSRAPATSRSRSIFIRSCALVMSFSAACSVAKLRSAASARHLSCST